MDAVVNNEQDGYRRGLCLAFVWPPSDSVSLSQPRGSHPLADLTPPPPASCVLSPRRPTRPEPR